MILLVGSEKGGTGKTTLATNLAAMRGKRGHDVLLVDTDKQSSASYWAATRDEDKDVTRVSCVQKFGKGICNEVLALAQKYKDLIIDAGGRDNFELRSSLTVADVVCVPIQASQFDVWTLAQLDELVCSAKALNPKLQAYIVLNRCSCNPSVSETAEVQALLKEYPTFSFSGVAIGDRIAFRKSASKGLAAFEMKPIDSKAVAEIESIYKVFFKD